MMLSQGHSITLHISKVTQSLGDFYLQVQIYLINNTHQSSGCICVMILFQP